MVTRDEPSTVRRIVKESGPTPRNAYLIVLAGGSVGKTFKLSEDDVVVGRSSVASIRLDHDGVSRNHARIDRAKDGRVMLHDLGSTNGTFINGVKITSHVLSDGDRIQLGSGTTLKFSYQDVIEEQVQKQLYDSATRDGLTDLHNRRFFDEQLDKDFSHALRHQRPLSVVMLDVDFFKQINDTHGHAAGDAVLQALSAAIMSAIRNEDLCCRVGGEEFALILRDTTMADAHVLCERLRSMVAETAVGHGSDELRLTISLGICTFDAAVHAQPGQLVEHADKQLYAAKHEGRNCVRPAPG